MEDTSLFHTKKGTREIRYYVHETETEGTVWLPPTEEIKAKDSAAAGQVLCKCCANDTGEAG